MNKPNSVVDYDAWKRGYMPPSEHVLIDELSYRGATVNLSSNWGDELGFWVVAKGFRIYGDDAHRVWSLIAEIIEKQITEKKKTGEQGSTVLHPELNEKKEA